MCLLYSNLYTLGAWMCTRWQWISQTAPTGVTGERKANSAPWVFIKLVKTVKQYKQVVLQFSFGNVALPNQHGISAMSTQCRPCCYGVAGCFEHQCLGKEPGTFGFYFGCWARSRQWACEPRTGEAFGASLACTLNLETIHLFFF